MKRLRRLRQKRIDRGVNEVHSSDSPMIGGDESFPQISIIETSGSLTTGDMNNNTSNNTNTNTSNNTSNSNKLPTSVNINGSVEKGISIDENKNISSIGESNSEFYSSRGKPKNSDDLSIAGHSNSSSISSSSFLSRLSGKSKNSSFTNGSALEQDSFVAISVTGLSSIGSSVNSLFSYDAFTGVHDEHLIDGQSHNDSDHDQHFTSKPQHNYLQCKKTTKKLPRLNFPSSTPHTKNFLQEIHHLDEIVNASIKEKTDYSDANISPQSSNTAATEPITPRDIGNHYEKNAVTDEHEFPVIPLNTTPNFDIPFAADSSHLKSIHGDSIISSTMQQSSKMSRHESSTNNTTAKSQLKAKRLLKDNQMAQAAIAEKEFWMEALTSNVIHHGKDSIETARTLNNLGSVLLQCKEYTEALSVYKRMIAILRQYFDEESLVFARALEKVGLAASKCSSEENLEWALIALNEALHLRILQLGPHHPDTVDTLNNIAGIFYHAKEWSRARDAYTDVLTVRAAIFGKNHPSVAVTAQTLGKVCSHLSDFEWSIEYFETALSIYKDEPMMLKNNHPLVKKTLKELNRTKQLKASFGFNNNRRSND